MDWTGYPKALGALAPVKTLADLALFLAPANDTMMLDKLNLIAKANASSGGIGVLATAYPREVMAYKLWLTINPLLPPLAPAFALSLASQPDPAPTTPPPTQPVSVPGVAIDVNRVLVYAIPASSQATVQMRHRKTTNDPWTNTQWTVPTPVVDVDPDLLETTEGAVLTITLSAAQP